MSEKTASQLIEERVQSMGEKGPVLVGTKYRYECMDTGMPFETLGEAAVCSPFTGGKNFQLKEEIAEQEYMQMTDVPANQKNQQVQTPLSPNPAPGQPGSASWQNTPWAGNPAPDASGSVGATSADGRGFVTYPQQSVPPHQTMTPGTRS